MIITEVFSAAGSGLEIQKGMADKPNLMVKTLSGTPSWVVVLQGSPNGVDWTTMLTHDSVTNISGESVFTGAQMFPSYFRRIVCVSVSGGQIAGFGWCGGVS